MMARGYFVTGTDTGVGKTRVSAALLYKLAETGATTVAMKPVASGCTRTSEGLRNEDALVLQQAATVEIAYEDVNPYAFEPAIAPHIAANQLGIVIDSVVIKSRFDKLVQLGEAIVVEGVGGWQVPVSNTQTMSDIAVLLDLPVILVVAMRLGCLNHALLTEQAITAMGLPVAGWIANSVSHEMDMLGENIESLKARIASPYLGHIPSIDHPNAENIASHITLP